MRILTFAAAFILSFALANTAPAQERYDNETLGLSVEKPASWHILTDKENRRNIARTKMTDAQFQSYVRKHSSAPVFMITKHRTPYNDLNPSVKINARPAGRINSRNLTAVAKHTIHSIAKKVGKVDAIEGPIPLKISGFPAAYAAIDYTLATQSGAKFPTKSQMWFVLKDDLLFIVGAGTRQDEKTGSRKEVQQVVDSIRLQ